MWFVYIGQASGMPLSYGHGKISTVIQYCTNYLTLKKKQKTSSFQFIFISKQQQLFSIGDTATSICNRLLNSFWHRFYELCAVLSNFMATVPHVNYSINELRLGSAISFLEPSFYYTQQIFDRA